MAASNFFFNSFGRLRSGWRFLIFCALFFLLAILTLSFIGVLVMFGSIFFAAVAPASETGSTSLFTFLVQAFVLLFSAVAAGWICAEKFENLPLKSLGWNLNANWLPHLLTGFALGALSLLLAALVAALFGNLTFAINQTAAQSAIVQTALISLAIFGVAAAGEEALFRGYPLQTFARARLVWVAVLITSTVFAAAHATNPNATWLGLCNTALAGVWFVAAYLKTRNLWFPLGLHWAWNWTMGAVLGIPVSGIEQLTTSPLFNRIDNGPAWLTGGEYGLEGGAACTIALVISTILIWFLPFLKPTAEMLSLTNEENPKKQTYESPHAPQSF